jgi:hypothetical protein
MLHYLPQLSLGELQDLFLCETKRFIEGIDSKMSHNELAAIRNSVKQIMEEIQRRKKITC